jgi:hypothetical protein
MIFGILLFLLLLCSLEVDLRLQRRHGGITSKTFDDGDIDISKNK